MAFVVVSAHCLIYSMMTCAYIGGNHCAHATMAHLTMVGQTVAHISLLHDHYHLNFDTISLCKHVEQFETK